MIKLIDILKTHRTDDLETTPLNNINLEVTDGEFLAIMGPSGCGKSTLLNIIGLMDTPTNGLYYFNDLELASFNEKQRADVRKNNVGIYKTLQAVGFSLSIAVENLLLSERSEPDDVIIAF